jgi:DNA-binding response OmpR family regulator
LSGCPDRIIRPDRDGYSAARHRRAHVDQSKIIDAGRDGYVAKPIDAKNFLREVDRLLARSATV